MQKSSLMGVNKLHFPFFFFYKEEDSDSINNNKNKNKEEETTQVHNKEIQKERR